MPGLAGAVAQAQPQVLASAEAATQPQPLVAADAAAAQLEQPATADTAGQLPAITGAGAADVGGAALGSNGQAAGPRAATHTSDYTVAFYSLSEQPKILGELATIRGL